MSTKRYSVSEEYTLTVIGNSSALHINGVCLDKKSLRLEMMPINLDEEKDVHPMLIDDTDTLILLRDMLIELCSGLAKV
jgi:hypothetical protein